MDNGTMVEAFKSLNYSQLAQPCLEAISESDSDSQTFISSSRRAIHWHGEHFIPLVSQQDCFSAGAPVQFKIFNEELSPVEYNEWIDRYGYKRQIPEKNQRYGKEYTQWNTFLGYKMWRNRKYDDGKYGFRAYADYKDSNGSRSVFDACVELNHENWPAFQHFIRLMTDPSVYIRSLKLVPLYELFNLLTGAMNSDHNRLRIQELVLEDSATYLPRFLKWIKDHAICDKLRVGVYEPNLDAEFRHFLMTGAKCTSKITVGGYDLCKVVVPFVQKFLDLKSCDENQLVESISWNVKKLDKEAVKCSYAEYIVKEERRNVLSYDGVVYNADGTELVFQFDNEDIGKKLRFTAIIFNSKYFDLVRVKIANL